MRFEIVSAGVVLTVILSALVGSAASNTDPCMNMLTLDDPALCLNVQALTAPEVCKEDQQLAVTPLVDLTPILAPPPVSGSTAEKDDLQAVLNAQARRTKGESRCVQADACLSIFRFAGVMGPGFKPDSLPNTTTLLNSVFSDADKDIAYAKVVFRRPRPFVADQRIRKIVKQCPDFSYPSGHSTFAYVVAILLANMVPEKRNEIFARADQYAYNRVVAGVHYPSDVEAGRISASVIDYTLMNDARFQKRFARARAELRGALGLRSN